METVVIVIIVILVLASISVGFWLLTRHKKKSDDSTKPPDAKPVNNLSHSPNKNLLIRILTPQIPSNPLTQPPSNPYSPPSNPSSPISPGTPASKFSPLGSLQIVNATAQMLGYYPNFEFLNEDQLRSVDSALSANPDIQYIDMYANPSSPNSAQCKFLVVLAQALDNAGVPPPHGFQVGTYLTNLNATLSKHSNFVVCSNALPSPVTFTSLTQILLAVIGLAEGQSATSLEIQAFKMLSQRCPQSHTPVNPPHVNPPSRPNNPPHINPPNNPVNPPNRPPNRPNRSVQTVSTDQVANVIKQILFLPQLPSSVTISDEQLKCINTQIRSSYNPPMQNIDVDLHSIIQDPTQAPNEDQCVFLEIIAASLVYCKVPFPSDFDATAYLKRVNATLPHGFTQVCPQALPSAITYAHLLGNLLYVIGVILASRNNDPANPDKFVPTTDENTYIASIFAKC